MALSTIHEDQRIIYLKIQNVNILNKTIIFYNKEYNINIITGKYNQYNRKQRKHSCRYCFNA